MLCKGIKNSAKLSETLTDFWRDFSHKTLVQNQYNLRIIYLKLRRTETVTFFKMIINVLSENIKKHLLKIIFSHICVRNRW